MNVESMVGGHITQDNIGEVVQTAKSVFSESSHETTKGEGRAQIYNFFKGKMGEIKTALTIPDDKGGLKPKYAVLKKFLIGEGIFQNADHYNRAMVSINHHNRATIKAEKETVLLAKKQERQAEYEALETDDERKAWLREESDKTFDAEIAGRQAKREAKRASVNKAISCLSDLENLRNLHREDAKGIETMLITIKSYLKETQTQKREVETES